MEETWKLSKKDFCRSSSSNSLSNSKSFFTRSSSTRSTSTKCSSSIKPSSLLQRSFSHKTSPSDQFSNNKFPLPLPRSCSTKSCSNGASNSKFNDQRSSDLPKSPSIGRKCSSLAKEQKARFYIMRRCVAMLVCWHKHGIDS